MKSRIVSVLLAFLAALSLVASPPETMRYQARLTDDAGVPLQGSFDLVFAIYDAPTSGTQLWSETWNNLNVSEGIVDIVLGTSPDPVPTPIQSSVFTGSAVRTC